MLLEIDDPYAVAALLLAGHSYKARKRVGRRVRFFFADEARLTLAKYFQGALQVDARNYADSIRAVRGAMHVAEVAP